MHTGTTQEWPTGDSSPAVGHTGTTGRVLSPADTESQRFARASHEAGQGEMLAPLDRRVLRADVKATLVMSSREIADLVEKRHDNVKRTIEDLAARGLVQPQLEDGQFSDVMGRARTESVYRIGKRDSYVIVAQLSPEFTARLVDRWQELEVGAGAVIPRTMAQALRFAAEQAEQIEAQAEQLAAAAPKVQFVDDYVTSTGNKGFREVCKVLKANERAFGSWLESAGIMYRLAGERMPYADHLKAGRLVVKAGTAKESGHAFNQASFTPKGVAWIAGKWAKHQLSGEETA